MLHICFPLSCCCAPALVRVCRQPVTWAQLTGPLYWAAVSVVCCAATPRRVGVLLPAALFYLPAVLFCSLVVCACMLRMEMESFMGGSNVLPGLPQGAARRPAIEQLWREGSTLHSLTQHAPCVLLMDRAPRCVVPVCPVCRLWLKRGACCHLAPGSVVL